MGLKWTKCKEHVLPPPNSQVGLHLAMHIYTIRSAKKLKNILLLFPHHPQKLMLQYSIKVNTL
jgi:hypothetical protein